MKALILAAAVALLSTGYALAADAVVADVVIVDSDYNWSGAYVGAQAGYAWENTEIRDVDDYPFSLAGDDYFDFDSDGIIGGLYAGYNWQMGQTVIGIEADISAADIDETVPNTMFDDPDESFSNELNWLGTVRGRLGYAIDRFLPYVTGGAAFADIRSSYNDDPDFAIADGVVWGWTAGAGVNYALNDQWVLKAEYLYVDLEDERAVLDEDFRFDFDNDIHTVRIGAAYRF